MRLSTNPRLIRAVITSAHPRGRVPVVDSSECARVCYQLLQQAAARRHGHGRTDGERAVCVMDRCNVAPTSSMSCCHCHCPHAATLHFTDRHRMDTRRDAGHADRLTTHQRPRDRTEVAGLELQGFFVCMPTERSWKAHSHRICDRLDSPKQKNTRCTTKYTKFNEKPSCCYGGLTVPKASVRLPGAEKSDFLA